MQGKIVLITGATSGIGKVAAQELARMGAKIVFLARNREKGIRAKQEIMTYGGHPYVDMIECNLASFQTVKAAADQFRTRYDRLDVLINNAGIWASDFTETIDGIESTLQVNHLSHFLLTSLLLDLLKKSAPARIINVSSSAHKAGVINFDDIEHRNKFGFLQVYGQSKLANILFTKKLAADLHDAGVTANCLHPGGVNTRLFDNTSKLFQILIRPILISPEKGAATTVYLASSGEVQAVSGAYFFKKKIKATKPQASDMAVAEKLWQVSAGFVKDYF